MTKTTSISQLGTPAFPIFVVWSDTIDEEGYELEHLSEELARFSTMSEAKEYAEKVAK